MKITIEGQMGEGKTTVVCMLLNVFNAAGFDVTLVGETEPEIPFSDPKVVQKRIARLAENPRKISIEIETRMIPRALRKT